MRRVRRHLVRDTTCGCAVRLWARRCDSRDSRHSRDIFPRALQKATTKSFLHFWREHFVSLIEDATSVDRSPWAWTSHDAVQGAAVVRTVRGEVTGTTNLWDGSVVCVCWGRGDD